MANAVEAVRRGESVRRAAELYSVPRSTLSDKVLCQVPLKARSGPPSYLSREEEEELTSFLLEMAKIGYAHTRKQVISLVQQIVEGKGISTVVSSGWWERYVCEATSSDSATCGRPTVNGTSNGFRPRTTGSVLQHA